MALIGPIALGGGGSGGGKTQKSRRGPRYSYRSINPGLYRQRPKSIRPISTGAVPGVTEPDLFPTKIPGITKVLAPTERGISYRDESGRSLFGAGPGGTFLFPTEYAGVFTEPGWTPPPPKTTGPTTEDGGKEAPPGYQPIDVEWIIGDYSVSDRAPAWWRPFDIRDKSQYNRPDVAFTLMANALIGSGALSDEDARALAKQLYAMWGRAGENPWDIYSDKFISEERPPGKRIGAYGRPAIARELALIGQTAPGGVIDRRDVYSRERAERILQALSRMREATVGGNVWKFGPGYQYLQNIAGALGTAGPVARTRAQRLEVLGALDPLLAQAKSGELSAFAPLAQMIAQPFYTYAPPRVSRTQEGRYQFGRRSKYLMF